MIAKIIIGKNFGDEGKGLATDYFALEAVKRGADVICVRHNGGAQAGHTVDLRKMRFVFSQLSSGSFRGADTYWADSFMPDLYKLSAEAESFVESGGRLPNIYASEKCRCTCIIDVLLNMLLETSRGSARHGSCGMGINEAAVRSATFPLYLGDVLGMSASDLYSRLRELRRDYLPLRLRELSADLSKAGEYGEMLKSDDVLYNAAEAMCRNGRYVQLMPQERLRSYDEVIFEGAQGLLLDELNTEYAPHLTTSRTGLYEPARILSALCGKEPFSAEAVYVTRSYVTRHGAGPLPYEGKLGIAVTDRTNVCNQWQGEFRTAPHGSTEEFMRAVLRDLAETKLKADISLFVTHLNESKGCIITDSGSIPVAEFCAETGGVFGRYYLSDSPFAEDVSVLGQLKG